jgi:hypothetical protein
MSAKFKDTIRMNSELIWITGQNERNREEMISIVFFLYCLFLSACVPHKAPVFPDGGTFGNWIVRTMILSINGLIH